MPLTFPIDLLAGRRGLLLAAAVACMLAAVPTSAQPRIESTTPAAGDTVHAAVREVRIRFTAGVESALTSLTLSRGGTHVASGGTAVPRTEGREYVLPLAAPLEPNAYEARWKTVGADGHVLRGEFSFVVAGDSGTAGAAPLPSAGGITDPAARVPEGVGHAGTPLAVAVRWGWFSALLAMIGAVAFRYGVLPPLDRDPVHHEVAARAEHAAWFVALGAAALSVATLMLRLWLQASALGGDAWSGERLRVLLLGTEWGLAWVLQAIATLAFVIGLFIAKAPYGRAAGWMGTAAGAVLLSAVPALSGHAAAVERLNAVAILNGTVHVLGAGVWLGTLLALLAVGVPAALSAGPRGRAALGAMLRAFAPIALAGAAAVGVTGIASALLQVGAPADLWTTGYGRTLLVKLLLLAVVAARALHDGRRVPPALDAADGPPRLRRAARGELALGAAVLLVTAVLVGLPAP